MINEEVENVSKHITETKIFHANEILMGFINNNNYKVYSKIYMHRLKYLHL